MTLAFVHMNQTIPKIKEKLRYFDGLSAFPIFDPTFWIQTWSFLIESIFYISKAVWDCDVIPFPSHKPGTQQTPAHSDSIGLYQQWSLWRSTMLPRIIFKGLFHPAFFAQVVSWLAFVVTIFMGHKNGDNKGRPRDDPCKEYWMKQTL